MRENEEMRLKPNFHNINWILWLLLRSVDFCKILNDLILKFKLKIYFPLAKALMK